jgi:uncharacterized membrane protein YkoI
MCLTLLLSVGTTAYSANQEISKQQAINIANDAWPGRVLSIKRVNDVYKVKTLSENGEVRIIIIDATSGKVLSGK